MHLSILYAYVSFRAVRGLGVLSHAVKLSRLPQETWQVVIRRFMEWTACTAARNISHIQVTAQTAAPRLSFGFKNEF